MGTRLDAGKLDRAIEAAAALPAFEDVAPALAALAGAGQRLVVLTNSGAEAGEGTLAANGVADPFERILGVDAVASAARPFDGTPPGASGRGDRVAAAG